MELKTYLKIIKKYWALAVLLPLLAAFSAFLVTKNQAPSYEGGISMLVSPFSTNPRENSPFYEYDGYYAIQSSQLFASTVANWLTSPDMVVAIYERAGVELKVKDTDELRLKIRSYTPGPQSSSNNVDVVVKGRSKEETKDLAQACVQEIVEKAEQFNRVSGAKINYKVEALGEPIIIKMQPKTVLNTIIAFILGVAGALTLIFFIHYFRKK